MGKNHEFEVHLGYEETLLKNKYTTLQLKKKIKGPTKLLFKVAISTFSLTWSSSHSMALLPPGHFLIFFLFTLPFSSEVKADVAQAVFELTM